MGEDVLQVSSVVPLRRETDDSFLKKVDLEGPHLGDENVDSHIPFGPSDK